ncbi:hypothetical protein ABZY09_30675 [Streptomyces sp. NPDC002928]|uniref:hypothetical protein n=1 Tax=Streptomyces sp. NPDC002928 TaxID=3154440 RepID=UPI0033A102D6
MNTNITEEQKSEAIDWTSDCLGLSGANKVGAGFAFLYVQKHYPGGWGAFVAECCTSVQPQSERSNDYPTGNASGMSFISNRWVFTGAEGYRVKQDSDDTHLSMVVRYNATGETPFYGGRGLSEDDAHAMAARLSGRSL